MIIYLYTQLFVKYILKMYLCNFTYKVLNEFNIFFSLPI
jgi:hypothetical protein